MSGEFMNEEAWTFVVSMPKKRDDFKPERVIYNGDYTICYWKDGTKTVVRANNEEAPNHEQGVAMCIVRKIFDSRGEFLRVVENGYEFTQKNAE